MKRVDLRPVAVLVVVLAGLSLYLEPFGGGLGFVDSVVALPQNGNSNSNGNENGNGNGNGNGNDNGNQSGGQDPSVVTATAVAGPACSAPGVEFQLQVCNDGLTDLQQVVVTDTLPVGMVFSDGTISGVDAQGAPIGVGLCDAGTVVAAADECPCEGGVTFLSMRYNGPDQSAVTVEAKNVVIFSATLNDGDVFDLYGSRADGRFQKNNLIFSVGGVDTAIHVSCSQPIGVGFVFGAFTIEAMASRNAGMFDAPCEPPPPSCPCEGGVTSLTLRFNGPDATPVTVEDDHTVIFDQILNDADAFVLTGSRSDGRFQKNNLVLSAGGEDTTIHVSCSQPIGIGSIFGPFTVEAFSSRLGGPFNAPCDGLTGPPPDEDHGDDHGDPCKGQKVKICLADPLPPGACVTVTFSATFANALCNRVKVEGQTGDTAPAGETVKTKATAEACLDDLLSQALGCVCAPAAPPTGACCFGDGSCIEVAQADCEAAGGTYQGDATDCASNPCPQPMGACCFGDGTCADDTQAGCEAVGGTYLGDGSNCASNPCPQQTGGGADPFDVEAFCGLDPSTCDPLAVEDCLFAFEDWINLMLFDAEDAFLSGRCDNCCPTLSPCDSFDADQCFFGG